MSDLQLQKLVTSLIERTKTNHLSWRKLHPSAFGSLGPRVEIAFVTPYKDRFLTTYVYEAVEFGTKGRYAAIAIMDDKYQRQWDITGENVNASDLWRLIRLIERKVYQIDDFVNNFLKDDPETEEA